MFSNSVLRFGIKVILTAAAILIVSSGSSYSNPFNSPAPLGIYAGLPAAADSIVFQNDSVFTIEGVKDELSGEGEWIKVTKAEIDPSGVTNGGGFDDEINTEYIWRPYNMEPGWSPYTNGYWRYSNYGWMWNSYYSWGWRPYHYGRWWWSDYYGWVWSPGFIFAPAWVVWIFNAGYYGWYPISPRVRWHHGYGYHCHHMRYHVRHWTFCEKRRFADPIITPGVIVDPMYNPGIIKGGTYSGNVTIVNDQVKNEGPPVGEIEIVTGVKQPKDDVSRYNNPAKVKEILNTDGNGQKEKYTGDPRRNDENDKYEKKTESKNDQGKKNNNDVKYEEKRTDENRNNDRNNEVKKNEEKRYEEKKSDEKRNDEKRNDDSKKEKYTPPEDKGDNGKNDSYSPPEDKNDNSSKNDNNRKSDDSKQDNSSKQNNSDQKNDSKDYNGSRKGKDN
jgi:hypothetical protein